MGILLVYLKVPYLKVVTDFHGVVTDYNMVS